MLYLGLSLYALNLAVGLAAQLGQQFGVWHHVLYAAVFVTAGAATLLEYHPALWVTLGALALMPKTRPRTAWHPVIALLGFCGYLGALTWPLSL